jgi:hypothetical protein
VARAGAGGGGGAVCRLRVRQREFLSRLLFFSFGIAEIERALRAHDVRVLLTGGRLGLEAAA